MEAKIQIAGTIFRRFLFAPAERRGGGAVTGFFGIGTFDAAVQDIADYNADGTDDLLLRTAGGVVGAALITGADAITWAEYGSLGIEWSTKGVGIL